MKTVVVRRPSARSIKRSKVPVLAVQHDGKKNRREKGKEKKKKEKEREKRDNCRNCKISDQPRKARGTGPAALFDRARGGSGRRSGGKQAAAPEL